MATATAPASRDDVRGGVLARATAGLVPYAPTILRVAAGIVFVVYGWNKLQNPAGWQDMLTGLGFPVPLVLSWFVLVLELVGGAALILGLLVRPLALLFAIEMVVSSVTVKLGLGFAPVGADMAGIELDLALLATALALVILGPGRLSVDRDVLHRELI
jgi:putative oxidoreductase